MLSMILNFHGIGPIPRAVDDEERNCWLNLDHFEAILDMVCNQSHISLTFDDGNASDIELVLPALLQRGLAASFFVCTMHLDQSTYLNRKQVKSLQANGMQIGSHGTVHRSWRGMPLDNLTAELLESRKELEKICGIPIVEAACPFGAYDRRVLRALQIAGYRKVYTSDGGWTSSAFWIQNRNTILRSHSIEDVAKLIRCRPNPIKRTITRSRIVLKKWR